MHVCIPRPRGVAAIFALALCATAAGVSPVFAQTQAAQSQTETQIERLERLIGEQAARISDQEKRLAEQQALLERQKLELGEIRILARGSLDALRAGGLAMAQQQTDAPVQIAQATPLVRPAAPTGPVGEAPPAAEAVEVAALPEGSGVLTPRGGFVFEPSIDYTHGSSNRLVFRGIEIVTGIQIGVIEASDADRNATSGSVSLRYGLTDRFEIEARVPYVYRADQITTLVQMEEAATRTFELEGRSLGDVEVAGRYQINNGSKGRPIFIANLRVKSDTGTSPFEIDRDEFGISSELATGSGFWGVEPALSFIYPTDPAVIFGSISYLAHLPRDIDRDVGGVQVGRVDPGDSIGASAGFGFALNPRFSFSLGYKHNYIFPTKSELGGTMQKSEPLQVGAFTFGWSFRLSERLTLSNAYEIGTTEDAPDMRVVFRLPIRF